MLNTNKQDMDSMSSSGDSLLVRKNIVNLTADELANYRRAVHEVMDISKTNPSDNRGYSYFAGMHGWPQFYCWHHGRNTHNQQKLRLFLPWHRAYLYIFEKSLQDRVPGVTIPYWDWRVMRKIPKEFSAKKVNGQSNPLHSFHMKFNTSQGPVDRDTHRSPQKSNQLPTDADVNQVLNIEDNDDHFDEFTDNMEEIHDSVHGWVGGDMGDISTAAYDPIFWSHHCMIDKLWWDWQKKSGVSEMPSNYLSMSLPPSNLTVKDVIEIYDLGYEYATASAGTAGNWG